MLTDDAVTAMNDYVDTAYEGRRAWVRSRASCVPGDPL
jgi:hypothetical protein